MFTSEYEQGKGEILGQNGVLPTRFAAAQHIDDGKYHDNEHHADHGQHTATLCRAFRF